MKRNFLVVAASPQVREELAGELRARGYSVTLAGSGSEAEKVVKHVAVEAVLVETNLPDATGPELKKSLKQIRPDCRVSLLTSFELIRNTPNQLRFGAKDYLVHEDQLFEMVLAPHEGNHTESSSFAQRGNDALIHVIDVLVGLRELDDRHFGGSTHQAMVLATEVTRELSNNQEMVQEVIIATLLRDVGKAVIDSPDLNLDADENARHEWTKDYVLSSVRLLEHIDFPWKCLPIIRHHNEWYDGTGFPDRLRGREIPMGARIVACVDAYVNLTSGMGSRLMSPEEAMAELIRQAGHRFDPEVVEMFQRALDKRLKGRRAKKQPEIVLIEPREEYQKLLMLRLVNEGYKVAKAESNDQALGLILKEQPDLVLADVDADPSESFQMLQELRDDDTLARMPVVFTSRSTDRVLKLRALREGVDEFLSKDEDLEELVAHVENIITREAIRQEGKKIKSRRGIAGDLRDLSLPDLVQTLVIGMKTAAISLTSDKLQGKVWFESGAPKHAVAGELEGEQAFYEMVRWQSGEFIIEHGIKAKRVTLDHDATFLLMEALRLVDEASAEAETAAS